MSFDPGMTLHINKKSVELKRMWHKLKEFFKALENYKCNMAYGRTWQKIE